MLKPITALMNEPTDIGYMYTTCTALSYVSHALLIPESKLQRVNLLLNHLTEVITGKDHLLRRLQSRATENSLKIEAPFQK